MAEGRFDETPGPEGSEGRKDEGARVAANAVAAALALDEAANHPDVRADASAFLRAQRRLVDLELKHFDEDRRWSIGVAKRKRFGDRLKNGLQLFAVLAATCAVIGLLAMAWDAAHDHGLVVEAFSVPPEFSQRGLTGQVVAKRVLDRLADLQSQTESRRAASSYKNDWGDQLKVEIPQTGVSIGDLQRYLVAWLGHQTRISGEVYRTASGLSVTARAGDGVANTATGPDADFDKLVQQAAEGIYQRTQPYRYATYLQEHGRLPEALAILQGRSHDPDPLERAWATMDIGIIRNALSPNSYGLAEEMHLALNIVPGFAPALLNLQATEANLGHDEEAVRLAGKAMSASESFRREISPERRAAAVASLLMNQDHLDGDYSDEIRQALRLENMPRAASQITGRDYLPGALLMTHDLAGARVAADRLPADVPDRFAVPGMVALEIGDPLSIGLLTQAREVEDRVGNERILAIRSYAPWLAVAKARFGDPAGAQMLISTTPTDCYLCVRARGMIAAARGDRAEAGRWFAEAIRQGPNIPQAYVDRGSARLAWGDVDGALSDGRRANAVSPHNADGLKLWGDALARRNLWRDAVTKYDAALPFAPAWAALHQARDTAIRQRG
jgi:tetratricopeptide (TPR) repeat protein